MTISTDPRPVDVWKGGPAVDNVTAPDSGELLRTVDVPDEEWERVMSVTANGSFYACRASIPAWRERYGRIVLSPDRRKEGNPMPRLLGENAR